MIGSPWLAIGRIHSEPDLISHVQLAIAGRHVKALPVGVFVIPGCLPRYARLVGIVVRVKNHLALGDVVCLDIKVGLLIGSVSAIHQHWCHAKADMDLVVDGVDVCRRHGGSLLNGRSQIGALVVQLESIVAPPGCSQSVRIGFRHILHRERENLADAIARAFSGEAQIRQGDAGGSRIGWSNWKN